MRLCRISCNTGLLACSIILSVLLSEIALRLTVDEVDYLEPDLVEHPVLFHAIAPGSGGHDAWGFRNRSVPTSADIVAIGDSQTYGVSATEYNSWPSWLSRLSGKAVYNMGIGGYGPFEYEYLLRQLAVRLEPKLVVIGLYFGNDLWDSYEFTTGFNDKQFKELEASSSKVLPGIRDYLAKHSVLYQAVKYQFDTLINFIRSREIMTSDSEDFIRARTAFGSTILTPNTRFSVLDQSMATNRIGLSETFNALTMIQKDCDQFRLRCIFVLIPTKESVYWPVVKDVLNELEYKSVLRLVETEKYVRKRISRFLSETGLESIDCLQAMRASAKSLDLYPAFGGHPNAHGYEMIARHIWSELHEMK